MIQLDILAGKKAGAQTVARHFPFRIGRAAQNDLQLEDDGVWDRHLVMEFQKNEGFKLIASAIATVNGEPTLQKILCNGDTITIGSAKLQFWIAAPRQRGLRSREIFVWALIAAVTAAQLTLIYWLIR